jgi:membrane protein implicated in regulation of membrane protease activity
VAVIWIVLAVVLAAAEIFTSTFVLLMFAIGALAAAVVAGVTDNATAQGLTFAVISATALFGLRPVLQRYLHRGAESAPMGLEAIEGSSGLVLERVDLDHGLIKIDGEMWSARPYDATQIFEAGERVRIIEVRGATALVWKE